MCYWLARFLLSLARPHWKKPFEEPSEADGIGDRAMKPTFRLSRVRAPRATPGALVLVAVVFLTFGLIASALGIADPGDAPRYVDGSPPTLAHWLVGLL
jgi:hypothetical protein